jgi:Recombinase zinc beta ribbon domain/Recombinase
MLRRELYRGVIIYGQKKWRRKGDSKVKAKSQEPPIRTVVPELRIIPEALWSAVQQRLERTRETYPGRRHNGQLNGRREAGLVSQYLLSGLLRCSCGGNMIVTSRTGRGGAKKYWICTTAHHRGKDICANVKGVPYEPLTQAVIDTFKENFFNPIALGKMLWHEIQRQQEAPQAAQGGD